MHSHLTAALTPRLSRPLGLSLAGDRRRLGRLGLRRLRRRAVQLRRPATASRCCCTCRRARPPPTPRWCSGTAPSPPLLLVCWAAGGVLFGWIADRIGRKRALFVTIAIYALGTGACALVSNLGQLILCRALAGLGIGGEWGIGAALVAEAVPENRRVEAGRDHADRFAARRGARRCGELPDHRRVVGGEPQSAWRYVFLAGLAAGGARGRRAAVPARERAVAGEPRARAPSTPRELFAPGLRAATLGGLFAAVDRDPHLVGVQCVHSAARQQPRRRARAQRRLAPRQARRSQRPGRRTPRTPSTSAGCSAPSRPYRSRAARPPSDVHRLLPVLGARAVRDLRCWRSRRRHALAMLFLVGAGVYGVFGAFTFYLPELFPAAAARHRRRLLLQHRTGARRLRSVRGRHGVARPRAARAPRSCRMLLLAGARAARARRCCALRLIVETRGRALPPETRVPSGRRARAASSLQSRTTSSAGASSSGQGGRAAVHPRRCGSRRRAPRPRPATGRRRRTGSRRRRARARAPGARSSAARAWPRRSGARSARARTACRARCARDRRCRC